MFRRTRHADELDAQPGFKENGVVNIAEKANFELAGQEEVCTQKPTAITVLDVAKLADVSPPITACAQPRAESALVACVAAAGQVALAAVRKC